MGERTRSLIGTSQGVRTVRVYSANPKTADGFNTFLFRRAIGRSLGKLFSKSVLDGRNNPMPEGIILGDKSCRYSDEERKAVRAFVIATARGQRGIVQNDDFGTIALGHVFIDEIQCHAISSKREILAVSSAHEIAATMVHFVASPNEEIRTKNGIKYFEYGLARVRLHDGIYLVMGEVGVRVGARPYYDQRVVAKIRADSEVTSLHGQSRIGESAFDEIYDNRFRLILQGVTEYFQQEG